MVIKLNGENYTTEAETVGILLKEIDIIPGRVAVELNLTIIKRDRYDETLLHDGDELEVVSFVGGGDSDGQLAQRVLMRGQGAEWVSHIPT